MKYLLFSLFLLNAISGCAPSQEEKEEAISNRQFEDQFIGLLNEHKASYERSVLFNQMLDSLGEPNLNNSDNKIITNQYYRIFWEDGWYPKSQVLRLEVNQDSIRVTSKIMRRDIRYGSMAVTAQFTHHVDWSIGEHFFTEMDKMDFFNAPYQTDAMWADADIIIIEKAQFNLSKGWQYNRIWRFKPDDKVLDKIITDLYERVDSVHFNKVMAVFRR